MKITKASSVFIQVVETDDSDLLYFRGQGGGWYRLQHDMSWKYLDNPDKYEEAYQEYVLASIPKWTHFLLATTTSDTQMF